MIEPTRAASPADSSNIAVSARCRSRAGRARACVAGIGLGVGGSRFEPCIRRRMTPLLGRDEELDLPSRRLASAEG